MSEATGQLRQAAARALVLAPGIVPLGMLFGASAMAQGWSLPQALATSGLVFAGAAQFAALALHGQGASLAAVAAVVLVVNSRYFLLTTAALELARPGKPSRGERIALSLLVVDESYALQSAWARQGGARPFGLVAVGASLWLLWMGATLAGSLLGDRAPPLAPFGLDYALPGLFVGLFGIFADSRPKLAVGLLAVALSAVAALAGLGIASVVLVPPALAFAAGRWLRGP
jgi:predicted branched-subunit amino acid permease